MYGTLRKGGEQYCQQIEMAGKKPSAKQTKTIIALKAIEKKNKLRAN